MTDAEYLKCTIKRCPWALQELVLDAKYTEANRLYSAGAGACITWLRSYYGRGRWGAVKALRRIIRQYARSTPKIDHRQFQEVKAELHRIRQSEAWAIEELTYLEKAAEARAMFDDAQAMYGYLLSVYESGQAVLASLVVASKRKRCKTVGVN